MHFIKNKTHSVLCFVFRVRSLELTTEAPVSQRAASQISTSVSSLSSNQEVVIVHKHILACLYGMSGVGWGWELG